MGDEEDTLKSFMAFDIILHGPVFRVVVESNCGPQRKVMTFQ